MIDMAPRRGAARKGRPMGSEERDASEVEEQRRRSAREEGSEEESEVEEQRRRSAREEGSDDEYSEVEEQKWVRR